MKISETIFNEKLEFNKWLKQLTCDEKKLIINMLDEAYDCGYSSGWGECIEE